MSQRENILIFGGTRYFGKGLVSELVKQGFEVTIATRGKAADSFSLIALKESLTLDTAKAQQAGFQFKTVLQWFEPLVKEWVGRCI